MSAPRTAAELHAAYRDYITTISRARWTISLELATLLTLLCELTKPRRLLDLGSGFSSYVFRRYQALSDRPVEVWSVDESEVWLQKTQTFLQAYGLPASRLELRDAFFARPPSPFDIVLFDLARKRGEYLPKALTLCPSPGLLVLDDFQILRYRRHVKKCIQGRPHTAYSLHAYARDRFARFALLVTDLA